MNRIWLLIVLLAGTLLISRPASAAETVLFREDFDLSANGWHSYISCGTGCQSAQEELTVTNGIGTTWSLYPHLWGVDRNHGDPGGLGDLNMIAGVCLPQNGNGGCASGIPALDLKNAILRVRIRLTCCEGTYPYGGLAYAGPTSETQTRLVWWFDTWDTTINRAVNMAAIGTPLDNDLADGQWHTVEVAPGLNDWACLGSIESQQYLYGCNPAAKVLGNVDVATGLILFPVDRQYVPVGKVEIDWLEVVK